MDELRLTGNHLKGSRPLVTFNKAFDEQPHLSLLKEMLKQVHFRKLPKTEYYNIHYTIRNMFHIIRAI